MQITVTFDSLEDFNRFGQFMGEASERFYDFSMASSQVKEMYEQAERLGVDPNQFLKNYDYWEQHLEKLQEAEPISWNRNRALFDLIWYEAMKNPTPMNPIA